MHNKVVYDIVAPFFDSGKAVGSLSLNPCVSLFYTVAPFNMSFLHSDGFSINTLDMSPLN